MTGVESRHWRMLVLLVSALVVFAMTTVSVGAHGLYYEAEATEVVPENTAITYRVRQDGAWTASVQQGAAGMTGQTAGSITNLDVAVTSPYDGCVQFKTYDEDGWSVYTTTTDTAITKGKVQAVRISLTGTLAAQYDIYYRVHVTNGTWLHWACNGQMAGSKDISQRLNAVDIRLVDKAGAAPGKTTNPVLVAPQVKYCAVLSEKKLSDSKEHGWGKTAGSKKNKTGMTGFRIRLSKSGLAGSVEYRVVAEDGKTGAWTKNGKLAGTQKSRQTIAGIQIRLTGQLAKAYDIYYRVKMQRYGWLDWSKNGETAGSQGYDLPATAYQVKLVKKQATCQLETKNGYLLAKEQSHVIKVNKQMNCITVYLNQKPLKAFVCSTGKATPTGTFYTMQKYRWKPLIHEVWGQYSTRVVGHILFHSVPYHEPDNRTLLTGSYRKLGTTASAGCIRLTCQDAKWIYDHCKLKTKVVIYQSKDPGPLGKPKAPTLKKGQTWDPTDPAFV